MNNEKIGQTNTYSPYSNGTIVYFNPVTGKKCTDYTASNSNTGIKTGCMIWYIFNDKGGNTVDLILDHNITISTAWSTSNSVAPNLIHQTLLSETSSWAGVPTRKDSYKDSVGGYTLNYNGARARLLTYEELREVGIDYGVTPSDSMFFFDRVSSSCVTNIGCLNNADNQAVQGYWTASISTITDDIYAWVIMDIDRLTDGSLNYLNGDGIGIRPVISVSRDLIR